MSDGFSAAATPSQPERQPPPARPLLPRQPAISCVKIFSLSSARVKIFSHSTGRAAGRSFPKAAQDVFDAVVLRGAFLAADAVFDALFTAAFDAVFAAGAGADVTAAAALAADLAAAFTAGAGADVAVAFAAVAGTAFTAAVAVAAGAVAATPVDATAPRPASISARNLPV